MRKAFLGAVVAGLVFASGAQAVTLEPARQPFQRWSDEALVPTPLGSVPLTVTLHPCGSWGVLLMNACVVQHGRDPRVIEIRPDAGNWDLYASLGDVFAAQTLGDDQRREIERVPGFRGWIWFDGAYAQCARGQTKRPLVARVCRAIQRVTPVALTP